VIKLYRDEGIAELFNRIKCGRSKRSIDINCLVSTSNAILENVVKGPAADFVNIQGAVAPIPRDPEAVRALIRFLSVGIPRGAQLLMTGEEFEPVVRVVFWMVYLASLGQSIRLENRIAASQVNKACPTMRTKCRDNECKGKDMICTVGTQKGCPCNEDCPPEELMPSCPNCGGNNGQNKCKGVGSIY
jgi:hypothetical protein